MQDYVLIFKKFDEDKSGNMGKKELKNLLIALGNRDVTDDDVSVILDQIDTSDDDVISFAEFLVFIKRMTEHQDSQSP